MLLLRGIKGEVMETRDFLKTADLFKGLDEKQIASIEEGILKLEFKKGDRIFSEGETAEHVWTVIDGEVALGFELPGRGPMEVNTLSTIPSGKTFGWSCFVPPWKYRLSSYCSSGTCAVVRLDKEYLQTLFEQDPRMGYKLVANLAGVIGERYHQLQVSATSAPYAAVKITVHLATCGIAAGAREVMNALTEEMSGGDRPHIRLATSGCIGRCKTEPNVTVEIEGEEPVIYQKMNADKIRRVFREHVLRGVVQSDLVLS
jgi:NADP-reducing hydrogenase subunit HndB